ncbi:alpha/beta hydrolase [Advenella mimigardefordensis]|uniref:Alpha/beta hydrolase fold domain-containing protein n=1 Tax=Advenella mimigardefordensis (strain DSM 17166 / LMG 22922 / DPN7) TaxID=1247726 RepID=W0PHK9_ADVMD|nr:alpha/beta hydrolase [Advenella mimigardefordensis]AHG65252.1 alpha/beta hydrolase fold domain-containing protein [Advenella mimigardefordensis DPN7]
MKLDQSAQALIDFSQKQNNPSPDQIPVAQLRDLSNAQRAHLQPSPPQLPSVLDSVIDGPAGGIRVRTYRAHAAMAKAPVIIFFHGGGFVLGDLESHDVVCRQICKESGCVVIAVDYRRAPESKFPAAVEDAIYAVHWVRAHAVELDIDENRMALMGDSAGANLATVAAIDMKRSGLPSVALQILLYPVTDQFNDYESKRRFQSGYLLTKKNIEFYAAQYFTSDSEKKDWRASPINFDDLSGLPEALVITAGFDPLVDEGEAYALRLAQAGVKVTLRRFTGQIHGFVTRGLIVPEAFEAIREAASLLKARFYQAER